MLFNSWPFVLFTVVTLVLYYLPPFRSKQPWILIIASFVFYAYGQLALILLLLASISINAICSYFVAVDEPGRRKFWAILGVTLNLGVLVFFKYSSLLARTFLPERAAHGSIGQFLVTIPLPIGISFFTFQGISLVVEVFRHSRNPSINHSAAAAHVVVARRFGEHLKNTGLFKSFFPQLVAGPIVKAYEFYPQIHPKTLKDIDWEAAFRALVVGYFLKMVIADNLADQTFWLEYPYFCVFSAWSLAALLVGFSIQIFADFAGYSLIAIGLAHLFGYQLPTNFNFPYLSLSFAEFWRRWHISLSTWLREYLYIPLGGNRKGAVRTYLNLFVVMFLGGLWHGAAWSYAIWGVFHGLALAAERLVRNWIRPPRSVILDILRAVAVFSFVTAAWLLFKLPKFEHVILFCRAILTNSGETRFIQIVWIAVLSGPIILYYAIHALKQKSKWHRQIRQWEFLAYGCLLVGIILNSGLRTRFIYFQF